MMIGLILSGSGLTGCVSSNYMAVGNETFPPRPDTYIIDVFLPTDAPVVVHQSIPNAKDISLVPKSAKVIGRIDTTGAPAAGWGDVIRDAQRRARTLGGDGIVVGQWGSHMTGVDGYGQAYYGKNIGMTVIRYD
jgi:hypothetical protein